MRLLRQRVRAPPALRPAVRLLEPGEEPLLVAGTGTPPPPPVAGWGTLAASAYSPYLPPAPPPKNRVVFVLLGTFLGMFGAHNFYAGYNKKAAIQLALTVLTCFYGALVSWIWAVVEICVVSEDADGERFA